MKCINPEFGELITLYEFDKLSREDKRKFEAHLLSCDDCFQNYYELAPVIERIRENPAHFLPALTPKPWWIRFKESLPRIRFEFNWRYVIPAAAAIVLFFLLIRPAAELSDLARIEPAPFRSLQVKSGAAASEAEKLFDAGMAAYVEKNYAGAIAKLTAAVQQDSANASFHFYLGLSYLLSHQVDPAIIYFRKTIALGGNSVLEKAYWYLGNAWLLKENRGQALQAFQKVVELEGDYQWEAKEILAKIRVVAE